MQPSNLIKVLAAFAAGIVVALGSALFYVRVTETVHPEPVAPVIAAASQHPVAAAPADPPAEQTAEPAPPQSPAPAAVESPAPVKPVKTRAKKHKAARPAVQDLTATAPDPPARPIPQVQTPVAQNMPPQGPASAPIPAVNESSAAPGPQSSSPESQDSASPAPPPPSQPHVVTLAAGTNIAVRLAETLSTDHNYSGDTFRATLDAPIVMDGFIIADKGSKVLGRVVEADKPGRVRGVGSLSVALTEINTTDGQRVAIATNSVEKRGSSNTGEDAAKIAGGAALGAIIGAIAGGGRGAAVGAGIGGAAGTGTVLATRGKAAALPVESRLTFQINAPVTITEKLK